MLRVEKIAVVRKCRFCSKDIQRGESAFYTSAKNYYHDKCVKEADK